MSDKRQSDFIRSIVDPELRVAKEAMEQLAAVTQERNSFQDQCIRMRHERHAEKEQLATVQKDYNELLYAVESKFPDETRHQTALRYIRTQEHGQTKIGAALRGKEGE